MSFDFSSVSQVPNKWFSTRLTYEGEGVAIFENPSGKVFGHTIATFEENGQYSIEMIVENVDAEVDLDLGIHRLLSADKPIIEGNKVSLPYPPKKYNPCKKLTIKTSSGVFTSTNINLVTASTSLNLEILTEKLRFYIRNSWFDEDTENIAYYWTVPLLNFIPEFIHNDESLGKHPLRIIPNATVLENIPDQNKQLANFVASQKSKLIVFEVGHQKAFIEGLPDFTERVKKLKGRVIPHSITSYLVMPLDGYSYDPIEEIDKWFPDHIIGVLELSTGNEIEFPWIEFRDERGNLLRRVHKLVKMPLFLEGIKIIDELFVNRGIGNLMQIGLSSPIARETFYRVALRHTILGGRKEQTIEDKLDHLCRALETLCEHFGFKTQRLLQCIDSQDKKEFYQELLKVESLVERLKVKAEGNEDFNQARYLETIIGRINNVANQDRNFGLAVCDLLSKFHLPDADIIDKYYSTNPRSDGRRTWAEVITKYRGSAIHSGYFTFQQRDLEILDILRTISHLHDVLTRMLLLLTGYSGQYLCETLGNNIAVPINWVQKNTPIEFLGYKERENQPFMIISTTLE